MSFGFSVGDFIALIHLAKKTYKNCVEAGSEYNDIAREIRSLYSVLKPLRDEAEKPDSGLFRQDQASAEELKNSIDGCGHILEDLQILLAKYEGLSTAGEPVSAPKKLWHRFRFSTKIEQLAAVRAKLISYTSTISVLLDAVQLRATGRVENKIDNVSSQMAEGFESLKKVILDMAVKARAEQRGGSTLSLLSLSTYAGDDKDIWRDFRRELIAMGFRSKALDRHKDLLQAYMLKLDQNGVLDEVGASSDQTTMEPWWKKHAFSETVNTLPGLQPIHEEASAASLRKPEKGKTKTPPPPEYSVIDVNKESLAAKLAPSVDQELISPKARQSPGLQNISERGTPVSNVKPSMLPSGVVPSSLNFTLDTDSEESEKETTGIRQPRRNRIKRQPGYKSSNGNPANLAADNSSTIPSEFPRISEHEDNVSAGGVIPLNPTKIAPKQMSNLAPAPLAQLQQVEEEFPDTFREPGNALNQPSERRKEAKEVRDSANKSTRQNLENPSATSTRERGGPNQTKFGSGGTPGGTESPKARRPTPRAGPARPFPSHAHSDPVPRVRTGHRPETQRRPISEINRGSKTSNLGAVAFGLAGLSLILGMRRRNKDREARGRSVSDGYYSYYSDSYTQTSESDDGDSDDEFEGDEKSPRNGKTGLENDWNGSSPRYSRGRQRTVPRTVREGKTAEGSLATKPVNAPTDSSSGSDLEVPGLKPSNSYGSLRATLRVKSGSGSSTPRENKTTNKATKADTKSNEETVTAWAENVASAEKDKKATETGLSTGQEENPERRFVISSRT